MKRILAFVDGGPLTVPVIDVARAAADIFKGEVDVVLVRQDDRITSESLAHPLVREVTGDDLSWCDSAISASDVDAVVVGIRALVGGRRPIGHFARHLIERCPYPVVAVPPTVPAEARSLRRLLVPVEGGRPTSETMQRLARRLTDSGRALVGLHILDRVTTPSFSDRWDDAAIWTEQFWEHNAPMIADRLVRTGDVAPQILTAALANGADSLVLEWKQNLDDQHALVVRAVLSETTVPVVLIPDLGPTPPNTITPPKNLEQT